MSLFQRTITPLRTSYTLRALKPNQRFLSTTRPLQALSENDRDTPERDAKIDAHKHDSIKKAKSGSGEWKPELASNSEQVRAADKHDLSMEEMQKMGEKKGKEDK